MDTLQISPSKTQEELPLGIARPVLHHVTPAVKSNSLPVTPVTEATDAPPAPQRTILITRTTRATGKAVKTTFHSLRGAHEFIVTGLFENTSMRKGLCEDAADLIMGQRELLRQTRFGPFLFTVDKTQFLRD